MSKNLCMNVHLLCVFCVHVRMCRCVNVYVHNSGGRPLVIPLCSYISSHIFSLPVFLSLSPSLFMPTAILAEAYCFCRLLKNLACFKICPFVVLMS